MKTKIGITYIVGHGKGFKFPSKKSMFDELEVSAKVLKHEITIKASGKLYAKSLSIDWDPRTYISPSSEPSHKYFSWGRIKQAIGEVNWVEVNSTSMESIILCREFNVIANLEPLQLSKNLYTFWIIE